MTNVEVRAVEVASGIVGDVEPVNATGQDEQARAAAGLPGQIPAGEKIVTVTAELPPVRAPPATP